MNESGNLIRVLIADDHAATRAGVRALLQKVPDIQVVGEATNGLEAQQLVAELRPDVLLLDLVMPGPRPSEIEKWVRTNYPATVTLVLTAHDRDAFLAEMLETGASGFVTKEESSDKLIQAIRRAARGERLFNGEQLARARRWREQVGQRWKSLTGRERLVLKGVAEGQSNQQIAKTLGIGEHTVETHLGNLFDKLEVTSRTEAATWVWRHGLAQELGLAGGNPPEKNGGFPGC